MKSLTAIMWCIAFLICSKVSSSAQNFDYSSNYIRVSSTLRKEIVPKYLIPLPEATFQEKLDIAKKLKPSEIGGRSLDDVHAFIFLPADSEEAYCYVSKSYKKIIPIAKNLLDSLYTTTYTQRIQMGYNCVDVMMNTRGEYEMVTQPNFQNSISVYPNGVVQFRTDVLSQGINLPRSETHRIKVSRDTILFLTSPPPVVK